MIIDLFVFPYALSALSTPMTFGRQMEGRQTQRSLVVLSIMMSTDTVLHICFSSHGNHTSLSAVCAYVCTSTTNMCMEPFCVSFCLYMCI